MSDRSSLSGDDDDETPFGATEMQALRRLAEPPMQAAPPAPEELWASRYRIVEPIGHGGMGDVFLARDVLLDRLVALKVLRTTSDENFADEKRLLREARAAARAEHERVARVYDMGTWNERAFIAMEYVRGETLRAWMKSHRPAAGEVMAVMCQLLEGLQALHERGLVHRDLKPENVMVSPDGNLRILDMGIARRVPLDHQDQTLGDAPGTISLGFGVGTPGYMAPEQWHNGNVDARADIFAVGVIAYELIAGEAPFRGTTNLEIREQTLRAEISFAAEEWRDVPNQMKMAVRQAIAREPAARFQNVAAMVEALGASRRSSFPPISVTPASSVDAASDERGGRQESLAASVVGRQERTPARPKAIWIATSVGVALVALLWISRKESKPLPHTPGMVGFAATSFVMGLEKTELDAMCATYPRGCPEEAKNEVPSRSVTVLPFELDEHEVTNEQFANFLTMIRASLHFQEDSDHHYPRFVRYARRPGDAFLLYDLWEPWRGVELLADAAFRARPGYETYPATLMTWYGAHLFCKSVDKRLPTESEWEYAARGVERRRYPWGDAPPDCARVRLPSNGWLSVEHPEQCDDQRGFAFPVMSAPGDMTPSGIFDMAGNAMEWVDNRGPGDLDDAVYAEHLSQESTEVIRGGAFNKSFMARGTSRNFRLGFQVGRNIGFRCAKSLGR